MERRRNRNARSATPASEIEEIVRNERYVLELRRKIRSLEEEAAEIKQRLNMILADFQANMTENSQLAYLQQEVEEQLMIQDSLNCALEEELNELRRVVRREQSQVGGMNSGPSVPSSSQGAENPQDADPEKKE